VGTLTSSFNTMATTRSQLRADVRTELKKDPNGRIWTDAELNNYIDK